MFRLFNLGGPSFTGINVKIENLHLTGRTFALLILGGEIIRAVSPYGLVDGMAKALAVSLCLFRILAPIREK